MNTALHVSEDSLAPPATGLRVMIGADTYPPHVNGAATFTARLAAGLAARGHQVHVLAPSTDRRSHTAVVEGVTEHRLPSLAVPGPPGFRAVPPGARARVGAVVAAVRPDVVHTQCHYAVGRTLLGAAREASVPTVATNHVIPDNLMHHLHLPARVDSVLERLAWADFARVVAGADVRTAPTLVAAALAQSHGAREVRAISCGTDLHRFHPFVDPAPFRARHHLPELPTVGFLGRLDAEKHVDELVRAFAAVRAGGLKAHLLVVGQGHQRSALQALATALGVGDHVTFTGYVAEGELPAAYAAADVWVNPGTAELQSIVTLEAMASAKPVIGADARALPLLVRDGVNGHLFAPGDVATLTAAITHVLSDDVAAQMMGRASLRLVAEHDSAATLDAFEGLYTQLVTSPLALRRATMVGA